MKSPEPKAKKTAKRKTIKQEEAKYILRLFVAGMSSRSLKAIERIRTICLLHLKGHYELEIIDIYQNPIFAKNGQIIAAPTLIKELPLPLKKFIGDMSDMDKLLVGLDLKSKQR